MPWPRVLVALSTAPPTLPLNSVCDFSAKIFENFKKQGLKGFDWPFSAVGDRYTRAL
jgi:hypothetical protein